MAQNDSQPQPFSRWIQQPQSLIALSALLLSLCGLFISIYEATLLRKSQRASVWPHVSVGASNARDSLQLWVQNTGVGPARVRAAAVTYRGETLTGWADLLRRVVEEKTEPPEIYRSLINGRVLPANSEKETVFSVTSDGTPPREAMVKLRRQLFDGVIDVTLCYCSVYEECWTASLQTLIQRQHHGFNAADSRSVEHCDSLERSGI